MAHARGIVGALEKYKVAGPGGAHRGTDVVKPLCPQTAHIPARMVDNPGHKAGAVKGSGRAGAAPHIRVANVFLGLGQYGGKGFIVQIFRGHLIAATGLARDVSVYIGRVGEQVGAVAKGRHIDGVPG